MLWPLVLPFQITACVIAGVIVCATLAAPLVKLRRLPTFLVVSLLGFLLFIPSCMGVEAFLDAKRFGVFTYDSFADVDDFRVERYLPPAARNITIDKQSYGFRARYTISQAELTAYLDDLWARYGDRSVTSRDQHSNGSCIDRELHEQTYGNLGWPYLPDAIELGSPRAGNHAGFTVWFSPSKQIAYEQANYW